MTNKNFYSEQIKKKVLLQELNGELHKSYEMFKDSKKQQEFKDNMAKKTGYYQKIYGFEIRNKKGNEYWNNEADAFKHTFGCAELYLKYGLAVSLFGGVEHERITPNNPKNEYNMDSWNNNQGREIAKEIKKEYGEDFKNFPQQKQDDIIAQKVMDRMHAGKFITNPDDKRKYNDIKEKNTEILINRFSKLTGNAVNIDYDHIFTPEEIGKMTSDEFAQNEEVIMQQLKEGLIKNNPPKIDYSDYKNSENGSSKIYTREDIKNMSSDEYLENEKAINSQLKTIGIPTESEMKEQVKSGNMIWVESYTRDDGTVVKGYYRSKPKE